MDVIQFIIGGEEAVIEMCPSLIYNTVKQKIETEEIPGVSSGKTDAPESEEPPAKKQESNKDIPACCRYCKASRLRVVNIESTGKRLLECANLRCLASVGYTDLPVGTIIEQEKATKKNYGWYLRDTSEMFYPSASTLELSPDAKFEYIPEVLQDKLRRVVVRCPGQRRLVLLE
ncbi:hypothetical protein RB195_009469 [Necator americanus]|uniref:Uncharacterized protein n=1 Tax=Necator americanus TaxID=51031 RepID=A0ABR1CTF6_NECAM